MFGISFFIHNGQLHHQNSIHLVSPKCSTTTAPSSNQQIPSITICPSPSPTPSTKKCLSFMSYTNGLDYDNNHAFSLEELGALTPADIHRYMCYKAYGKPEVEPGDLPRLCRFASLKV
jgi:hypothetical protein